MTKTNLLLIEPTEVKDDLKDHSGYHHADHGVARRGPIGTKPDQRDHHDHPEDPYRVEQVQPTKASPPQTQVGTTDPRRVVRQGRFSHRDSVHING